MGLAARLEQMTSLRTTQRPPAYPPGLPSRRFGTSARARALPGVLAVDRFEGGEHLRIDQMVAPVQKRATVAPGRVARIPLLSDGTERHAWQFATPRSGDLLAFTSSAVARIHRRAGRELARHRVGAVTVQAEVAQEF